MLSFECIKNEKSVYFLLTSAFWLLLDNFCRSKKSGVYQCPEYYGLASGENENDYVTNDSDDSVLSGTERQLPDDAQS